MVWWTNGRTYMYRFGLDYYVEVERTTAPDGKSSHKVLNYLIVSDPPYPWDGVLAPASNVIVYGPLEAYLLDTPDAKICVRRTDNVRSKDNRWQPIGIVRELK